MARFTRLHSVGRGTLALLAAMALVGSALVAGALPAAAVDPPPVDWAVRMGGSGTALARGVAVDGSGNVYVAGYFQGTVDFDPSAAAAPMTSVGSVDAFVAKLDAAGGFGWAVGMGSATGHADAYGLAVDGAGNVYAVGQFGGVVDFDPGPGVAQLDSSGGNGGFVVRLDAAGNFDWAANAGRSARAVAVDGSGDAYVTGYFAGTVDIDPGPAVVPLTSVGGDDVFAAKLDAAGNLAWAGSIGGSSLDAGTGIAVDGSGVYLAGYFYATADFDPGPAAAPLTSAGDADGFVAKLDLAGNYGWAARVGSSTHYDLSYAVAVDGSGNAYVVGDFQGVATFQPGAVGSLTAAGSSDVFVGRLDASGTFTWAGALGGGSLDTGQRVALDGAGNVYVTGHFWATGDFDPGPAVAPLTSPGGTDVFVVMLDAAGGFQWAARMGGPATTYGLGLAVDAPGDVYTTGAFQGTGDFDPGPGTLPMTATGGRDVFVARFLPADTTPPVIVPSIVGTLGGSGWYTSDVDLTWSVSDPESAITSTSGCTPQTITVDTAGWLATCSATSAGGTAYVEVTIKRDTTPPVTTATADPPPNAAGWNSTPVTVSFSGTDAMSGVDFCDPDVVLAGEGTDQSASGTCTDVAGNVSTAAAATGIDIDLTLPAATAAVVPPPNAAGWNNTPVTVSFTAVDALSGVASCDAAVSLSGEGIGQSASGTCADVAGNINGVAVTGLSIDQTPPTATATMAPPPNAAGWNNTPVTVSFSGVDALSGVDFCDPAVVLPGEGSSQPASGTCTDVAGNVSAPATASIDIDLTPPTAAASAAPPPNAAGWNNTPVTVSFTGVDALSGAASCDPNVVLSSEGTGLSAAGTCTDAAGNVSAAAAATGIDIDYYGPAVTATAAPPPNAAGWNDTPVTVSFAGVDALSGVDLCDPPVVLSGDGANQWASGSCTDLAGNTNHGTATGINIDQNPPALIVDEVGTPRYGWLPDETHASFPARVGADPVRLVMTTADLSGVGEVLVDGQPAAGGPTSWALGEIGLNQGPNTLTAVATDLAGHTAARSVDVVLDSDLDNDGIRNDVDRKPRFPSVDFSDQYTTGLGSVPLGLALTPDESHVYVAAYGSGAVSVIDTATSDVVASIPVGGRPWDVAISPDGARAYVTNHSEHVVHVIDTATNVELPPAIPVADGPHGIAVSPDGAQVYTANWSGYISVIDVATRAVTTHSVYGRPLDVAVSADGTRLVATGWTRLSVYGLPSLEPLASRSLGDMWWSYGVAIQPVTGLVYVTDEIGRRVLVYDLSLTFVDEIGTGTIPLAVGLSTDGAMAYVANTNDGTVTVIDAVSRTATGTIAVGDWPRAVAFGDSHAYVANAGSTSNSVSIIDTANSIVVDTVAATPAGTTGGTIADLGAQTVWITDMPLPFGVLVEASGSGDPPAKIDPCYSGVLVSFPSGSSGEIYCSSVTLSVHTGTVQVEFETDEGVGGVATVTAGNTFILHPPLFPGDEPFSISVPDTNPDPVLVVINGHDVYLHPGADNVPPIVDTLTVPADPLPIGTLVAATAAFTDLDAADTHTATWDWGDDSTSPGAVDDGTVTGDHVYTAGGVYTVTLTVTDDAGGTGLATSDFVVVYDPGGKDFHGSAKHDLGDEQVTAGFQLKATDNAPFVKGHVKVELTPHDDALPAHEFEADDLTGLYFFTDWALATGSGVWETAGTGIDTEFVVSGFDGDATGTGDTVRVKVWREGQPEMVLFDTQLGAADFAFPALVPDKGKIKIKTG